MLQFYHLSINTQSDHHHAARLERALWRECKYDMRKGVIYVCTRRATTTTKREWNDHFETYIYDIYKIYNFAIFLYTRRAATRSKLGTRALESVYKYKICK